MMGKLEIHLVEISTRVVSLVIKTKVNKHTFIVEQEDLALRKYGRGWGSDVDRGEAVCLRCVVLLTKSNWQIYSNYSI